MGDSAAFRATRASRDHVAAPPQASEPSASAYADRPRPGRTQRQVQRLRPSGAPAGVTPARPSTVPARLVDEALRGPGQPLAAPVREEMQARLGADFSDVRIHNGSAARASAAEISARAYTSGSHVVIGDGGADKRTLAHELTHVIQQRQGPVAGRDTGSGLSLSDPSDRFERAAEATAYRVLAAPVAAADAGPSHAPQAVPDERNTRSGSRGRDAVVQRSGRGRGRNLTATMEEDEEEKSKEEMKEESEAEGSNEKSEEESEEELPEGRVPPEVIKEIASPKHRKSTYSGGGKAKEIPKLPEEDRPKKKRKKGEKEREGKKKELACWEWAVRAERDSGGLDRGVFWNYLSGWELRDEELRQVKNEVTHQLQGKLEKLQNDLKTAEMAKGPEGLDEKHDEDKIEPLMRRAVEFFVEAHGFEIAKDNPAGWIMCHYKKTGGFGVPEHWWIELPTPEGKRVLIQTVQDIPHFEAGATNLRWNDPKSVPGRKAGFKQYVTIEVPVKALKDEHIEVLKRIVK